MKRIVLTGGGTAGHVVPNIALIPSLMAHDYDIHYIGSMEGIEKTLIEDCNLPYYGISSGKFRRYHDLKNISDPLRVLKGYGEALNILKRIRPHVVFSKGGFVSVPVVYAARTCGIPVIIHESDMTPGLANRLSIPFAKKICCSFPETAQALGSRKGVFTGSPIRKELTMGSVSHALDFTGLTSDLPTLLVIGGSLGAASVNEAIRRILPTLLEDFQVIHICGKDKIDPTLNNISGYAQYEFVKNELRDLFALADIIISRAGSNAIFEFLLLNKPNLLIPLPAASSRGDQILNARSFDHQGFSMVLPEELITDELLLEKILSLYENREKYTETMSRSNETNAVETIVGLIEENANK